MNSTVRKLMQGNADNHMLPFFWQHGEDEATLRAYMAAIQEANCNAVCVESRPHPDFCGPKWWEDMDVILDEARKRNMQVWILDDSHFPTGFANDALKGKPDSLCRQNIFVKEKVYDGKACRKVLNLKRLGFFKQEKIPVSGMVSKFLSMMPPARKFSDDSILCVTARQGDTTVDLTARLRDQTLVWDKPAGQWTLSAVIRSRNTGYHRNYINMTQEESCRLLIDAVYEPHWQHYAADFGKTIVGFFSDEPEFGNGPMYAKDNFMGTEQDLPWGENMEREVARALGENWHEKLHLLWRDGSEAPQVRCKYMDILTRQVRSAFSEQVAAWCRDHGVQYIGHVIEDDGQHTRTGSSLGHYFRSLQGQDMAGIDDIGGQVYPQGEEEPRVNFMRMPRNGEFYHYALAKLAQSAAAIEPRKKGNAMCEIFGNYGWAEGVRLEKYLADHFLVRGINQFVPHAFSPKKFPDQDCPPHFYAHGHNPQYRHFGQLCGYMNRVATLTSSGRHVTHVAVLYHAEAEWADSGAMPFEKPLRALYDHQIDCHVVPADIFTETDYYQTVLGAPLTVNGRKYHAFVVPEATALPAAAVQGLQVLAEKGLPIYFVNKRPTMVAETGAPLPAALLQIPMVALDALQETVAALGLAVPKVEPASDRIRILQIDGDTPVYFLVNEAAESYTGTVTLPTGGSCYLYDPWFQTCAAAAADEENGGTQVRLTLEPLKSIAVVFGDCELPLAEQIACTGEVTEHLRRHRLPLLRRSQSRRCAR